MSSRYLFSRNWPESEATSVIIISHFFLGFKGRAMIEVLQKKLNNKKKAKKKSVNKIEEQKIKRIKKRINDE